MCMVACDFLASHVVCVLQFPTQYSGSTMTMRIKQLLKMNAWWSFSLTVPLSKKHKMKGFWLSSISLGFSISHCGLKCVEAKTHNFLTSTRKLLSCCCYHNQDGSCLKYYLLIFSSHPCVSLHPSLLLPSCLWCGFMWCYFPECCLSFALT